MKLGEPSTAVDCVIRAIVGSSTLIEGELPQGVVLEENRLVGTVSAQAVHVQVRSVVLNYPEDR
jgi:hypothetical protein